MNGYRSVNWSLVGACRRAWASALLVALLVFGVAACETDEGEDDAGEGDTGDGCEAASEAFEAYVAANGACEEDTDCVIIGDCGPNADFRAIARGASAEGTRLMGARCEGNYDGPTYRAVCDEGTCRAGLDGGFCGAPAETTLDQGEDVAPDGPDEDGDLPEEPDTTIEPDAVDPDADEPDAAEPDAAEPDAVDSGEDLAEMGDLAAACTGSGGTVTTGTCCESTDPFPDLCSVGACGCAPAYSHEIALCDCGAGRCFNGTSCVGE